VKNPKILEYSFFLSTNFFPLRQSTKIKKFQKLAKEEKKEAEILLLRKSGFR